MDKRKSKTEWFVRLPTRRWPVNGFRTVVLITTTGALFPGCSLQQERFSTPEEAVGAFAAAVRADNPEEIQRVLGRDSEEIVASGDEVADRQTRERFLDAYDEKNALVTEADGSVTLQVGDDDWPMPIPIVKRWGAWRFDTRRGREEILNRRIGRNEIFVLNVCHAIVDAQREYMAEDRNGDGVPEYARRFISDDGKKNGLYWPTGEDEPQSPLGPLVADAADEGYATTASESGEPRPFHGYYFKMLTSQGSSAPGGVRDYTVEGRMSGGFAVVAWPAEYGNSGVMTFLVNHIGIVYERDLGEQTEEIARPMTTFDPGPEWSVVCTTDLH